MNAWPRRSSTAASAGEILAQAEEAARGLGDLSSPVEQLAPQRLALLGAELGAETGDVMPPGLEELGLGAVCEPALQEIVLDVAGAHAPGLGCLEHRLPFLVVDLPIRPRHLDDWDQRERRDALGPHPQLDEALQHLLVADARRPRERLPGLLQPAERLAPLDEQTILLEEEAVLQLAAGGDARGPISHAGNVR